VFSAPRARQSRANAVMSTSCFCRSVCMCQCVLALCFYLCIRRLFSPHACVTVQSSSSAFQHVLYKWPQWPNVAWNFVFTYCYDWSRWYSYDYLRTRTRP